MAGVLGVFGAIALLPSVCWAQNGQAVQVAQPVQQGRSFDNRMRLSVLGALGVGGEAELIFDGDSTGIEDDLDPTFGAGFRFTMPLWNYVIVGGQTTINSISGSSTDDREPILDLTTLAGGRLPLATRLPVELTLLLPLGPSFGFFENQDTAFGINFGVLAGAQVMVTEMIGLWTEIGFVGRYLSLEDDFGITTIQAAFNSGIQVRL
ncbi:MAG: hypothetical protein AAF355_14815 [Myxococcota bacterium]